MEIKNTEFQVVVNTERELRKGAGKGHPHL